MMGKFVAIDMREGDGRWGEFLRIRVELDRTKSLRRCVNIGKAPGGKPRLCMINYPLLPLLPGHSTIGRQRRNRWRGGSDYFRYDIFWANETECMGKLMVAWSECQGDTADKIKRVAWELEDWRKKEEKRDTGKKKKCYNR
ncbi:hypothetical protein V6N11_037008 [Hibiscus sabdariffa]|uniref:Uncharacterized protein n=1 Tax=Hibiscus sabdariffa TaxID=183260 RepID=A0ABR1ZIG6_9ROSI